MRRVTNQSIPALQLARRRDAVLASLPAAAGEVVERALAAGRRVEAALRRPSPPLLTTGTMTVVTIGCSALMLFVLFGSASPRAAPEQGLTVEIVAKAERIGAEPIEPEPPPRAAPQWAADLISRPAERLPLLATAALTHPLPSPGSAETAAPPTTAPPARTEDEDDDFTGVWAVNEKACTPQVGRGGFLPTIINPQGAWAGETTCAFRSARRDGKGWSFAATCSDVSRSWRSDVHLSVEGKRLTWKSQSGSRTYVRCDLAQGRADMAL
jgi:hypothetical protein